MINYGKFVKPLFILLFVPIFTKATNPLARPISEIAYPSGIVINEILPSPEGPDEKEEWLEIFNQNGFEVDLTDWQIQDIAGKTKTYTFPKETKISPQGFLVLPRPETKITLNNDSDGLSIIQPDGKIVDSVKYEKAPRGKSYNRIDSGWAWSNTLTPGSANIIPIPVSKIEKESPAKKELAAIGEQVPEPSKSLLTLLIALAIAIFSGTIILILKKQLKNFDLSKKLE